MANKAKKRPTPPSSPPPMTIDAIERPVNDRRWEPSPDLTSGRTSCPYRNPYPNDPPLSWPLYPLNHESRSIGYHNWSESERHKDTRDRYTPDYTDVAAFFRWHIDFLPYAPQWSQWHALLFIQCGLNDEQCASLDAKQIAVVLDNTFMPDEKPRVAAALSTLADRLAQIEHKRRSILDDQSELGLELQAKTCDIANKIGAMLYRTHGLPNDLWFLGFNQGRLTDDLFFNALRNTVMPESNVTVDWSLVIRQLSYVIDTLDGHAHSTLFLYPNRQEVVLDGASYALNADQTKILAALIDAKCHFVPAKEILGRRIKAVVEEIPEPVRNQIESVQGRGSRLMITGVIRD